MSVQEIPLLLHTLSSEKQHGTPSADDGMLFPGNAIPTY